MCNYLSFNGCNFSTDKIEEYKLFNYHELLVLSTLFRLSSCSKIINKTFDGLTYFWFDQRKFLERPEVSMSIRTLQTITSSLEKSGFISRYVERSSKGTYSFFRINDKFNELIVSFDTQEEVSVPEDPAQEVAEGNEDNCVPKEELIKPKQYNKSYSYNTSKEYEKENYTYQEFSNQIDIDEDELSANPVKQKCLDIVKQYVFSKNHSSKFYADGQQLCYEKFIGLLKSLTKDHFNQVIDYMKNTEIHTSFAASFYTALFKAPSVCASKIFTPSEKTSHPGKVNKFNNFPQRQRSEDDWEKLERDLLAVSYSF